MLTETGRVIAVEDDGLWVETLKTSSCARCAANKGCGQRLLVGGRPGSGMTFIKALFREPSLNVVWKVGDYAVLGIDEGALATAALIAYGIPLLSMVGGMLVGANLAGMLSTDTGAVLGAVSGLACGALGVRWHARSSTSRDYYQAIVIGKV